MADETVKQESKQLTLVVVNQLAEHVQFKVRKRQQAFQHSSRRSACTEPGQPQHHNLLRECTFSTDMHTSAAAAALTATAKEHVSQASPPAVTELLGHQHSQVKLNTKFEKVFAAYQENRASPDTSRLSEGCANMLARCSTPTRYLFFVAFLQVPENPAESHSCLIMGELHRLSCCVSCADFYMTDSALSQRQHQQR